MNVTFKTRAAKGGVPVTTNATIDWTGMDADAIKKLALRAVIIDTQAMYRAGTIPATDTINVLELSKRVRGSFVMTPEKLSAKALAMPLEAKQALMAQLAADIKSAQSGK